MKRTYTILALLVMTMVSFAKEKVKVKYLEEMELVSVVAHLADVPGYNWDKQYVLGEYLDDVDSCFAPYKSHPAVEFVRKKLEPHGFSWDFPMAVARRFSIVNGKIVYKKDLVAEYSDYYKRISKANEKKFLALLQKFYADSRFQKFYKKHLPLYKECEEAMQTMVDKIDFGWYDRFFGPKQNCEQNVFLGILIGGANYAVHNKKSAKGKDVEIVDAVMGCCSKRDGRIYYGPEYTLPIIIHEFNHSYCNPLNEEVWENISDKATELYTPNAEFYKSEAYGNPLYVMNETFVEACVIRYLMSHPELDLNGFTIEDCIQIDLRKKFYMIRDIIKVLEEREANPDLYKTMRDFMPRYIEAVNNYKVEIP